MKLASQIPSSISLMPSFWPASTVEMLMRCDEAESSASGDQQFADLAKGQMPRL
jgi:hypothetical protein